MSPRRYFCNQCHVPQSDAKPLVGNTFKPGTGMPHTTEAVIQQWEQSNVQR